MDARLAKITPGRNARRYIRGRKARFAGMKTTSRSNARLPSAGGEARWREEVMLALARQEAKRASLLTQDSLH